MSDVTGILAQIEQGDPQAAEQLLPLVYNELRRLAAEKMAHEKPGQTLDATALVHEAYLRLVASGDPAARGERQWNSRAHFFRTAAEAMRRILIDRARRKQSLKRGGDLERVDLDQVAASTELPAEDVLAVSLALDKLTEHAPEKAELVKLRYFGGHSLEEAAEILGISRATAARHWGYAKTWLYCQLAGDRKQENS
jgi:RNA polymerase sigma factor (TIGR02999 family)